MRFIANGVVLLAFLMSIGSAIEASAASTSVVISEFRSRGPGGALDEFIEIYNLSASPVSVTGWTFRSSNNAGFTASMGGISMPLPLDPGCHYFFVHLGIGYTGSVVPTGSYVGAFLDDGGIALLDASNNIVDQVGMSAGSAYKEGAVLAPLTTNVNRSYERKPGGILGSGLDSDDNATDFQLIQPSDEQFPGCIAQPTASENTSWGGVKNLYR